MEIKLTKSYASRFGQPTIDRIDSRIFLLRYFGECLECSFCGDMCCAYGVDIDVENLKRIKPYADDLEKYTGISRDDWFKEEVVLAEEFPGGAYTRTQVKDGRCVFLNRTNRGCLIHGFCLERKLDFHLLKPLVSCLFPVTFTGSLLVPANEICDGSLICSNVGASLYRGARCDLRYYLGDDFIEELDALEAETTKQEA